MPAVSSLHYYTSWLLIGLVLIALLSAAITRHLRGHVQRHAQAQLLLDALARYALWVAAQRSGSAMGPDRATADAALRDARALQARCFPALEPALRDLLASDRRLHAFMREQQSLRVHDPEAWLDSQPAPQLDMLWARHAQSLTALMLQVEAEATAAPFAH